MNEIQLLFIEKEDEEWRRKKKIMEKLVAIFKRECKTYLKIYSPDLVNTPAHEHMVNCFCTGFYRALGIERSSVVYLNDLTAEELEKGLTLIQDEEFFSRVIGGWCDSVASSISEWLFSPSQFVLFALLFEDHTYTNAYLYHMQTSLARALGNAYAAIRDANLQNIFYYRRRLMPFFEILSERCSSVKRLTELLKRIDEENIKRLPGDLRTRIMPDGAVAGRVLRDLLLEHFKHYLGAATNNKEAVEEGIEIAKTKAFREAVRECFSVIEWEKLEVTEDK